MMRPLRHALSLMAAALTLAGGLHTALAQPQGYATWSQVEAAKETRAYKERLRDGGPFDVSAKAYLAEIALPQLSRDANRRTIDRTRRRMRELLLTEIADDKAFEEANRVVRDFMAALARDDQADPVVRVNAMLLVGDLKGRDGKPWPAAVAALAAAVRDAALLPGVRVAALAGLSRHADTLRTAPEQAVADFAREAGPAVLGILAAAAPKNAAAADGRSAEAVWMMSRALTILPVMSKAAPKNVAAAVAAVVDDASWPVDVRVRAAAALGATATPQSGINAVAAVESIRKLAVAALEADIAAAELRRAEQAYRALIGGQPGIAAMPIAPAPGQFGFGEGMSPQPQDTGTIPEQVIRRDAWRLATLADAILSPDGKRGVAALAGKDANAAASLATTLRENALSLDAAPSEDAIVAAIESLAAPQAAAPKTPAAPKPAAAPAQPEPAASPFETSPFGQ